MKIGVLMPTHNRPDIIRRAILSLLGQKTDDYQVIVIANGMPFEMMVEYKESLSLLRDVENCKVLWYPWFANVAQALQFGLAHLNPDTEYVSVLEDDDEWHPEFLAAMTKRLDMHAECAMAYCDEIELDPDGIEVDWTGHPDLFNRAELLENNWIHFPVQMWRYRVLVSSGGFSSETSGAADWDIALRMSSFGVQHVREKLVIHHWLSSRFDPDPQNNCLSGAKMNAANQWIKVRKQAGVYTL